MTGSRDGVVAEALRQVTQDSADEHGMPVGLRAGYLGALLTVARSGGRLSGEEENTCRRLDGEAAAAGVALPALADLHMTASRRLWPSLPELVGAVRGKPVRAAELVGIGEAVCGRGPARTAVRRSP